VTKTKIAAAADIAEGQAVTFPLSRNGRPTQGFVIRFQGQLVAYENQCRHLPLRLDYESGDFFTRDRQHIICQTHNATYEPLTGLCIRGPCEGLSLKPLKIEVIDGEVWFIDEFR